MGRHLRDKLIYDGESRVRPDMCGSSAGHSIAYSIARHPSPGTVAGRVHFLLTTRHAYRPVPYVRTVYILYRTRVTTTDSIVYREFRLVTVARLRVRRALAFARGHRRTRTPPAIPNPILYADPHAYVQCVSRLSC